MLKWYPFLFVHSFYFSAFAFYPYVFLISLCHSPSFSFSCENQFECLFINFDWLLILSHETSLLFFFNSITHCRINFLFLNHIFVVTTFSAPLTSHDCSIFAVEMPWYSYILRIDTFKVG